MSEKMIAVINDAVPFRHMANVESWNSVVLIGKYGSRSKGGFATAGAAYVDAYDYTQREPGNVTGILVEPVYKAGGDLESVTESMLAYDRRGSQRVAVEAVPGALAA